MIHHLLALWPYPFRLIQDMWWPESGQGYAIFSSVGGDTAIASGAFVMWRAHRCDGCRRRIGRHPTADGHHKLCRVCHPDLPNRRLSLSEIHERHHAAKRS